MLLEEVSRAAPARRTADNGVSANPGYLATGEDAQCSQGWSHRGRDTAVQGHAGIGGDRSHGSAVGHVSAAGFSSGHHGGGSSRRAVEPGTQLPDPPGGYQHQMSISDAVPTGQSAGSSHLRVLNASLLEEPATHLLPTFRLSSPNNLCYINSFCMPSGLQPMLLNVLRSFRGFFRKSHERHCALHVLRFQLLGWTQPQRQHDVAELVDFVHPRIAPEEFRGRFESRSDGPRGVDCQIEGDGTKCIRLVRPPKHRPEIQALIRFWHEQESVHGRLGSSCSCPDLKS